MEDILVASTDGETDVQTGRQAIGPRIRTARTARGLGLRELARKLDVSPGHISQVERGLVTPSITLLYAIVAELDLSMDGLFEEHEVGDIDTPPDVPTTPGEEKFVTRRRNRRSIDLDSGVRWELLAPTSKEAMDFREIVYAPAGGSSSDGKAIRHRGREYGLVLEGVLNVQVGFDQYVLSAGDSIAFDSTVPHRFWNEGAVQVRAVWCTLPDVEPQPMNEA